jgi:DNA-binding transcriptional regulator YdaS (Cro superfamily)
LAHVNKFLYYFRKNSKYFFVAFCQCCLYSCAMSPDHPLRRAISLARSQQELARRVRAITQRKCAQQNVQYWLDSANGVSAESVISVALAVDFQVTPHELRPDLYPHPDDGLPADLRSRGTAP